MVLHLTCDADTNAYWDACSPYAADGYTASNVTDIELSPDDCFHIAGGTWIHSRNAIGHDPVATLVLLTLGELLAVFSMQQFNVVRELSLVARAFATRGIALRPNPACCFVYSNRVHVPLLCGLGSVIFLTVIVAGASENEDAAYVSNLPFLANTTCNTSSVFVALPVEFAAPTIEGDIANLTKVAFCFLDGNPTSPVAAPGGIAVGSNYVSAFLGYLPWFASILPFVFAVYGPYSFSLLGGASLHRELGDTMAKWYTTGISTMVDGWRRTDIAIKKAKEAKQPIHMSSHTDCCEFCCTGVVNDWLDDYGDLMVYFAYHAKEPIPATFFQSLYDGMIPGVCNTAYKPVVPVQ